MSKLFRKSDLVEIVRHLNIKFRALKLDAVKLSLNKNELINCLSSNITCGSFIQENKTKKKVSKPKSPATLQQLAVAILRRKTYPVLALRIHIAQAHFPTSKYDWVSRTSHIPQEVHVTLLGGESLCFEPYY